MKSQSLSRRDFLRGAGASGILLLGSSLAAFKQSSALLSAVTGLAEQAGEKFVPDAEVSLTATAKWVQILPGEQTRVWSYEGELVSGSGVTVEPVLGSYLGPILRVKKGTKLRLLFHNKLAEKSVLHPHGLRVPENCDGHPMQAIDPGQTKVYDFKVIDRAGPYWFHPHPMMRTSEQVVMGLAGLFYVWDQEEEATVPGASTGANDVPVVIQDRTFESNNQFLYQPNMMWGYLGDRILVNGQPDVALSLEPRAYRFRILNGSNARTYKLAWSNGMPLTVIGTDGGLLPAAVTRNYVMLMPGERVDVWVDLATLAGQQVELGSLGFIAGHGMMGGGMGMMGGGMGMRRGGMGMMGGGMGMMGMGTVLPHGAAFKILTVNVARQASTHPVLGTFSPLSLHYDAGNVPNYTAPRPFILGMQHMMAWTINGRVYEMEAVAEDEKVYRDEPIAWEWINNSPIPHPMHIHNVQFQVVERTAPPLTNSYSTVNQGFVDSGWKDTVLVWPGERVKIAMTFGPEVGMYMYHCHILEHEDMTMMRNLMIMDSKMSGM